MSSEPDKKVQEVFIDRLGAKYPYVTVDKSVTGSYGIRFYPSIYCIDADGNVHSVPDDRMPSESEIEDLLQNVSLAPKLPKASQYSALRRMWDKKEHAKIRDYLAKMLAQPNLDAEMRGVFEAQKEALDKRVERQATRVEKLAQGPDYYAASRQLDKITKDWKGFAVGGKAAAELARFKKDSKIKKEIASGKSLAKLVARYDTSRISQAKKLEEALYKFTKSKKHAGTYAAEQARKKLGG